MPYGTEVDEQYLLDVEREAFISLVSEMKSQARITTHACKRKSHYVTNNEGDIVMREAVIVAGAEHQWKNKEGFIKNSSSDDLGALVVKALKRANYEGPIDDLIFGCAMPESRARFKYGS